MTSQHLIILALPRCRAYWLWLYGQMVMLPFLLLLHNHGSISSAFLSPLRFFKYVALILSERVGKLPYYGQRHSIVLAFGRYLRHS